MSFNPEDIYIVHPMYIITALVQITDICLPTSCICKIKSAGVASRTQLTIETITAIERISQIASSANASSTRMTKIPNTFYTKISHYLKSPIKLCILISAP